MSTAFGNYDNDIPTVSTTTTSISGGMICSFSGLKHTGAGVTTSDGRKRTTPTGVGHRPLMSFTGTATRQHRQISIWFAINSISSPVSSVSSAGGATCATRPASPATSGAAVDGSGAVRVGFGPAASSTPSGGPLFAESYQRNNSHTSALPDMAAGRSVLRSRSRSVDSELRRNEETGEQNGRQRRRPPLVSDRRGSMDANRENVGDDVGDESIRIRTHNAEETSQKNRG
uniref:Uncharacterized protein n=1 Tax=Anopheles farauti TaxID=69004 RepID=A0A182Q2U2_9DIPT